MADVQEYINKGIELPAAPTIITQLTSLLNNEEVSSHELALVEIGRASCRERV